MSLLIALLIGVAAGAAGQFLLRKEPDTALLNILMGVIGSILGLAFYFLLAPNTITTSLFNLPSMLFSVIGALIWVLGFSSLHQLVEKKTNGKE